MRTRLEPALDRIRRCRAITKSFLEGLTPDEWFWQPGPGMNHVAWHVGHLAFAQYFLCLKRVRDRTEADESLISTDFLKRYKRDSTPSPDPGENFTVEEILRTFNGVYEVSLKELAERTDKELEVPTSPPHPMFTSKLGAIEWCSLHELMHCGQIVLLRRLMGKAPVW